MELSLLMVFGISIGIMIAVFIVYFCIRASYAYHDLISNIGRIIAGGIVAGGGFGILLGAMLCFVLPTHLYITSQDSSNSHDTRFVLDREFTDKYGRTYLINLTDANCYMAAMAYGECKLKEEDQPIINIPAGYIVEVEHDINKWFEPFPEQVKSEGKGDVKWNVLSEQMLISEYKKIGIDLTEK